jgi:uncharacterized protein (TIGR00255 family)
MTGFAARKGQGEGASWQWDLRSVNGKGLDLRLRLPEWIDGLEPLVRAELSRRIQRGNVALTLKLQRDAARDAMRVNRAVLDQALAALSEVTLVAEQCGMILAPASAVEVLAMPGVLEPAAAEGDDIAPLRAALMADLAHLVEDFCGVRKAEGAALHAVLASQIDLVASLTQDAATVATERRAAMAGALQAALARVLANAEGVDDTRLAQEIAFIAVKADVTEEIDRLTAHVAAARGLLSDPGPVGRKLDFLTQEFNREANTLCSKAQAIALTRIGLDLKTVIDQMREQIQNVE